MFINLPISKEFASRTILNAPENEVVIKDLNKFVEVVNSHSRIKLLDPTEEGFDTKTMQEFFEGNFLVYVPSLYHYGFLNSYVAVVYQTEKGEKFIDYGNLVHVDHDFITIKVNKKEKHDIERHPVFTQLFLINPKYIPSSLLPETDNTAA